MKQVWKFSIALIIIAIMSISMCQAQEVSTKTSNKNARAQKREAKLVESRRVFAETISSGYFRFNVASIDVDSAPVLAYTQLKGGYMLYLKDDKLTVILPLGGSNISRGNAPEALEEMKFTTSKYRIAISSTRSGGMMAGIEAVDPNTNVNYAFHIKLENGKTHLTAFVAGLEKVRYRGSLVALKKRDE